MTSGIREQISRTVLMPIVITSTRALHDHGTASAILDQQDLASRFQRAPRERGRGGGGGGGVQVAPPNAAAYLSWTNWSTNCRSTGCIVSGGTISWQACGGTGTRATVALREQPFMPRNWSE